jgi:hypothetical protein
METMLRLQCDNLLGGRIERETPTGLVTIATVAWSISRVFRRGIVTTCSGG